jgi:cellulose synthase/poly-beta-1,6-N-acetylglucosamine synthase-like glycosyltransferase
VNRRKRTSIIALMLFAAYSLFVVVVAIAGSGHGSAFWVSIGVILLLAAGAVWLARWIYRRRVT